MEQCHSILATLLAKGSGERLDEAVDRYPGRALCCLVDANKDALVLIVLRIESRCPVARLDRSRVEGLKLLRESLHLRQPIGTPAGEVVDALRDLGLAQ